MVVKVPYSYREVVKILFDHAVANKRFQAPNEQRVKATAGFEIIPKDEN